MYMMLGVSLCFSISFTAVDLLNAYHDRHSYDLRRRSLVSTPQQVRALPPSSCSPPSSATSRHLPPSPAIS